MRIDLRQFALGAVRKKLTIINREITAKYSQPFPKRFSTLLSFYRFRPRYVGISPTGEIQGGLANLVIVNINLEFVRSILVDKYKIEIIAMVILLICLRLSIPGLSFDTTVALEFIASCLPSVLLLREPTLLS